jgi:VWFA-related protein
MYVSMLLSGSHRYSWPLLLLLVSGVLSPALAGDPLEHSYRVSTNEVRLDFSVLDRSNDSVATLRASDFAVVDNDAIVRNFKSFSRTDWKQLEIAVLVDGSDSVRPRWREEIASILDVVSESAGMARENLSLFSIRDSQTAMVCTENCLVSEVAEHLSAPPSGLTPLFDSIVTAAKFLARQGDTDTKKILLIFSDGADTMSQHSLADAIDFSVGKDVEIDCVELNQGSGGATGVLEKLSRTSGGSTFPLNKDATNAMNVILHSFHTSYTVTYSLPSYTSGFHSVHILPTHNLSLEFRSRNGYYYSGNVR